MRPNVKILSVIFLMVFGFNLSAEISFSVSEIPALHSAEISTSYLKNHSYSYQNQHHQTKDVSSDHSNCEDCCPLQGCHFNHCAQVPQLNSQYISFFSKSLDLVPINFNFLFPDSPFLEGLRRPPRIS